jgi:hypothetical protein
MDFDGPRRPDLMIVNSRDPTLFARAHVSA